MLTFGKGELGDPLLTDGSRANTYPFDHRPLLDVGSIDQRVSMVRSLLSEALMAGLCQRADIDEVIHEIAHSADAGLFHLWY